MSSTSGSRQRTLHRASCFVVCTRWGKPGGEADGKGCLACGSPECCESGHPQVSPARPPQNLCTALLRRRRRTGANPISAWSRFDSDNGTISWLQTANSRCRQRQNRDRSTGLNDRSMSTLPTNHELSAHRAFRHSALCQNAEQWITTTGSYERPALKDPESCRRDPVFNLSLQPFLDVRIALHSRDCRFHPLC